MSLKFKKSFTFLFIGCLSAFCAASVFAQNKMLEPVSSIESSPETLKSTPETQVLRADAEKSRLYKPTSALPSVPSDENGKKIISENKSGVEKIEGAVGKPDDIAAAILFLASDEARFINGTSLAVDGGRLDIL